MAQCVASRNSRDKVARKILFYVVANIGLLFRDLWELQERGNVQSPSKPFAKLRRPQRKKKIRVLLWVLGGPRMNIL